MQLGQEEASPFLVRGEPAWLDLQLGGRTGIAELGVWVAEVE